MIRMPCYLWKSGTPGEGLDHHIKSDQYRIILSLMEISGEPPEIKLNTISKTEGLEAIEVVRA